MGVSKSTVNNIWRSHNLKPHRVKTFKLSRDPHFLEKLTDVVVLYLNPPEKAIVLCVDEKSQILGNFLHPDQQFSLIPISVFLDPDQ